MAYYITNGIDKINTKQGIRMIVDFLIDNYVEDITVEIRHIATTDECVLIQTRTNGGGYCNLVIIDDTHVIVNPIDTYGDATRDTKRFIEEMPAKLRDIRLDKILE